MAAKANKDEGAKAQNEELKNAEVTAPNNLTRSVAEWEALEAPSYGGQSPILVIKVGQVVGPITFNSIKEVASGDREGDTMTQTTGLLDGKTHRLPLSATVVRAVQDAQLQHGDGFWIMRHEDVIKEKGKGKGQAMGIYEIKVTDRAKKPE